MGMGMGRGMRNGRGIRRGRGRSGGEGGLAASWELELVTVAVQPEGLLVQGIKPQSLRLSSPSYPQRVPKTILEEAGPPRRSACARPIEETIVFTPFPPFFSTSHLPALPPHHLSAAAAPHLRLRPALDDLCILRRQPRPEARLLGLRQDAARF